jgi:hypothetical protein
VPVIVGGQTSTPTPPAPPPRNRPAFRDGLRSTWTGWDGTTWDLSGDTGGVCLQEGVRGMHTPPFTLYQSEAPGVAGSHPRGKHTLSRDVFWPLRLYSDGSAQDWIDYDDRFWLTMDAEKYGVWSVTQPNGVSRHLDLLYIGDDGTWDFDPALRGWNLYGISMVAPQPFWRGDPILREFHTEAPVVFFGPPGIINISSGSSTDTANITNPGDEPGWIVWTLRGPIDSASVGFVGAQIPVPFSLTEGEVVTIWTKPDQMIAIDGTGDERTLGAAAKFQSIPARHTSRLLVSIVASEAGGTVEAELTPYYRRAIGRASL